MKIPLIHHNHSHDHNPETVLVILYILCSLMASKVTCINNDFYPEEREVLINIRESLSSNLVNLHATWTGPPCHKNDTNWHGVSCRNSHVVSIVLDGLNLTGSLASMRFQKLSLLTMLSLAENSISGHLPNDLSTLAHLERLSLRNNLFSGPVPPFNQPSLTVFDVSENEFSGEIPDTPVLRVFPARCFDGNPGLCGKPLPRACPSFPAERKKRRLGAWRVALIAGFVPLVVVVGLLVFYCRVVRGREKVIKEVHADARSVGLPNGKRSRLRDPEKDVEPEFFNKEMPVFDLDELLQGSAEVLGKGALGTTYKTTLETGQCVAVKRLTGLAELGEKEFTQHMQLLTVTGCHHDNLVAIVSFYFSGDEKLVVSEFIPGGTLFQLLHDDRGEGRAPLCWETRLSIVKDIAKGLAFLHHSLPRHKVPHANLKSSNIFIAADFRAKLADFGFFPLTTSHKKCDEDCALAVARSPEHTEGKRVTYKSDIYCFGIVVLEIVTGKIPGEISPAAEDGTDMDLSDWVRFVVNKDWSTDILDDEIVEAREGHDEMLRLTEIALQCTDEAPEKRPKMTEVLHRIEEIEQSIGVDKLG